MRTPVLTTSDHRRLDRYLERILDAYKAGEVTQDSIAGSIGQIVAAVDKGDRDTALNWLTGGVEQLKSPVVK
jgi:hypothetical protein